MNGQVADMEEVGSIPEERRCVFVFEDGRRCRMRRWGAELCFHHDPAAAEKRKNRGRPLSHLRMLTATEVHALLTETMQKLQEGQISAGEAYATGYLAQLVLGNLGRVVEEYKQAKNWWEHEMEVLTRVRRLDAGWALAQDAEVDAEDTEAGRDDTAKSREVTRDDSEVTDREASKQAAGVDSGGGGQ